MQAENFGSLKRVDLQTLWPGGERDFTPWLLENLTVLGEAMGLGLDPGIQEAPSGPFSLNLLVYDSDYDRPVIIQNQLAPTDYDHLGKLLTYAAGHDASVAVWVASMFRDEHRQAVDWLNQRTDISTEFFGVVVEALQIDDSRPASNFRLVASPNNWPKIYRGAAGPKLSSKGEAYESFFQGLIDALREEHNFTKARKAMPIGWYCFSAGTGGVQYSIVFAGGDLVQADMCICSDDAAWNKRLFDDLHAQHQAIEAEFGETLSWERLDAKRVYRIAVRRPGSIEGPPEALKEVREWAIDRLLRFKDVIEPRAVDRAAADPEPSSLTDVADTL